MYRSAPAVALLAFAVGCREGGGLPSAPDPAPALATSSAQTLPLHQVSGGLEFTCGVNTESRAHCWGKDYTGQLGDGSSGWGLTRLTPVAVGGGHEFRQVSAGGDHACGVTTDFRAYCWGANYGGQLGDNTTADRSTPVPVAGGLRFRQVDAGPFAHTCGVTYPDNRAYCWGNNLFGQIGDGTVNTLRRVPVQVVGGRKFRQLTTGYNHSCGVTTSNEAFCWGTNREGQVGDGSEINRRQRPARVAGGLSFQQIDAGRDHTCAVTTNDRAFCWGWGGNGRIGDGTTLERRSPKAVAGGLRFDRVSAGRTHSCGETTGNRAYCWGNNASGQLGDGTNTQRLNPVPVIGGLQFAQVGAGDFHSCAVSQASAAYCWGANAHGELGDGTTTNRPEPVPVAGVM